MRYWMPSKKYNYFALLALVGIALGYGYAHRGLFLNLKRVSACSLAALILLIFVSQILGGYRFRYLMRVFKMNLPFRDCFGLSVCNTMFSYYLPGRGGMAVLAYYLKKKHEFSYSHYTALIVGSNLIGFAFSAGMGLGLTLLCKPLYGVLYGKLAAIFTGLLLLTMTGALLLVLFLKLGKGFNNRRFGDILEIVKEGLVLFHKNRQFVVSFSAFYVASIFVVGARLFVCLSAIDIVVLPLQMLIIASLATFSMLLPLTPASLGVREGIISYSAHLFGLPADKAMLGALIDRGAGMILTFSMGIIFSRVLLANKKS